jgi:hypothetical protein
MIFRITRIFLLSLIVGLVLPGIAFAQTYSFSLPEATVHVYWNEDGTSSIVYLLNFVNDTSASPIDYVDVGVPNANYSLSNVSAEVNGQPVFDIAESPYVKPGIAIGLGSSMIQPGETGQVRVTIDGVNRVLYPDSTDDNYASAVFDTTYFDSSFLQGQTDLTVVFHLPPGVQPEEPRWHASPSGWPTQPETGFDDQGRITYTWQNPNADFSKANQFGASFPASYVPDSAIVRSSPFACVGPLLIPLICIGSVVFLIVWSVRAGQRRKMQYLPPKIAIEGHGIKRGLTAVEAGILMEQPMDKIMTMILFGTIKKNAAQVSTRDPLELKVSDPLPEDLYTYEKDFLKAFKEAPGATRQKALQKTMIELVRGVGEKMKGFSRRETVDYYRTIMEQAWAQVEAADTPEVKSEKFDEVMEWTMLDKDYDDRTKEVFRESPVFVPVWWPRYDPTFSGPVVRPTSGPIATGGPSVPSGSSMPTLPGSAFAASVVTGVQGFSSRVVGNITDFTNGVTKVTNPPPKPTTYSSGRSSSGGGGRSCACACACACAGCACACAGGGR